MKRKHSIILGCVLLIIAIIFIEYAVHHPEGSFPWENRVTFVIYGVYVALIFKFLIEIPLSNRIQQEHKSAFNVHIKVFLYFILAIVFSVMAATSKPASVYTALQAFIVFESCDLARENLLRYLKRREDKTANSSM